MYALFPLLALLLYVIVPAIVLYALFWVVRLGVRYGLRDHDRWKQQLPG